MGLTAALLTSQCGRGYNVAMDPRDEMTADEVGLLNLIRGVKRSSGFGEIVISIRERRIDMAKKIVENIKL